MGEFDPSDNRGSSWTFADGRKLHFGPDDGSRYRGSDSSWMAGADIPPEPHYEVSWRDGSGGSGHFPVPQVEALRIIEAVKTARLDPKLIERAKRLRRATLATADRDAGIDTSNLRKPTAEELDQADDIIEAGLLRRGTELGLSIVDQMAWERADVDYEALGYPETGVKLCWDVEALAALLMFGSKAIAAVADEMPLDRKTDGATDKG